MSDESNAVDDDGLLALTRQVAEAGDLPPEGLRDVAIRALLWDTDPLLADLVSVGDGSAGMRGQPTTTRDYVFTTSGAEIAMSIDELEPSRWALHGLLPAGVSDVAITTPGEAPRAVDCGADGSFDVEIDSLPVAVAFVTASGDRVRTPLLGLD